jgi:hypothetical protein
MGASVTSATIPMAVIDVMLHQGERAASGRS